MPTFYIKQNDTSPSIEVGLKTPKGLVVNLTDATVVFNMKDAYGQPLVTRQSATVHDAVGGVVRYIWVSGDTSVAGDHRAEFEVTFPGGSVETFPNASDITVSIREEVG